MFRLIFILCLLTLAGVFSTTAQQQPTPTTSFTHNPRIAEVDSLLIRLTAQDLFSGTVLIADSSKILLAKGYGYSDRENKIKNTPDTKFDLASGSKIFTGTAITLLAQQGKLKFTDTVGKYIPDFPGGNEITIHELLTHSAGVDEYWKANDFSYKNIKNCNDVLPFLRAMPLAYSPGDSCVYSTGNLIVLGAIVEKITGMNFQDYVKKTFIKPLGLTNTNFNSYWQLNDQQREYAVGYRKKDSLGYIRNEYNYDSGFLPLSAGGAWSSVTDLYTFDKAVFSGRIVNDDYLKKMTAKYTPQWESCHFGYIWINTEKNGYHSIGHAGSSSGWLTINDYYPRQKYTLIILANIGFIDVFNLQDKIADSLFSREK